MSFASSDFRAVAFSVIHPTPSCSTSFAATLRRTRAGQKSLIRRRGKNRRIAVIYLAEFFCDDGDENKFVVCSGDGCPTSRGDWLGSRFNGGAGARRPSWDRTPAPSGRG